MAIKLKGRHLVSIADLTPEEFMQIIQTAVSLKQDLYCGHRPELLKNKTLAEIFQKPSLRTRVAFESAMTHLGGHGIYLGPEDIKLGKREITEDIAKVLSGMCDVIMARVFENKIIRDLAQYTTVPVINGLCDWEHPTQILADFMTIWEKRQRFHGLKLAYIGDGNNVCNSLLLGSALMGTHMVAITAPGYEPKKTIMDHAASLAKRYNTGSQLSITNDPVMGIKEADLVYTDVWASMGQESEAEARKKVFLPYQVNKTLFSHASPDALFMHCLPAHYDEEVTYDVAHSSQSVIFEEAENRMHSIKALLVLLTPN